MVDLSALKEERDKWDRRFDAIIRRSRRGERNLQLAAASAFGAWAALNRIIKKLEG